MFYGEHDADSWLNKQLEAISPNFSLQHNLGTFRRVIKILGKKLEIETPDFADNTYNKFLIKFKSFIGDVSAAEIQHKLESFSLQEIYDLIRISVYRKDIKCLNFLCVRFCNMDHNAHCNFKQPSPVMLAVKLGSLEILQRLLISNFDAVSRDDSGYTPLMQALAWGRKNIAVLLLEHGVPYSEADISVHLQPRKKHETESEYIRRAAMVKRAELNIFDALNACLPCMRTFAEKFIAMYWQKYDELVNDDETMPAAEPGFRTTVNLRFTQALNFALRVLCPHGINSIVGKQLEYKILQAMAQHPAQELFRLHMSYEVAGDQAKLIHNKIKPQLGDFDRTFKKCFASYLEQKLPKKMTTGFNLKRG